MPTFLAIHLHPIEPRGWSLLADIWINQIFVCELAGLSTYLEPDEGDAFKTEKETMTAEGLIKIIYAFLKTS